MYIFVCLVCSLGTVCVRNGKNEDRVEKKMEEEKACNGIVCQRLNPYYIFIYVNGRPRQKRWVEKY